MKYYQIDEFAKLIGRIPKTLRNWDESNVLKAYAIVATGIDTIHKSWWN